MTLIGLANRIHYLIVNKKHTSLSMTDTTLEYVIISVVNFTISEIIWEDSKYQGGSV